MTKTAGIRDSEPEGETVRALSATERDELAESHGGAHPSGVVAVSYSGLSTYHRCPRQYQLRNIERIPTEPNGAAIAGQAAHKVIEEMILDGWFRRPDIVEDEGRKGFMTYFDEGLRAVDAEFVHNDDGKVTEVRGVYWGGQKRALRDEDDKVVKDDQGQTIKVGENYLWMAKNGPTWVKRAATLLRRDLENGMVVAEANVERRVSVWLDGEGSTLITGIIDLTLLATKDDQAVIRDWKTGRFNDPMQLANYAWLLENLDAVDARISATYGQIAYLRGSKQEDWLKEYDLRAWKPLVPVFFREMLHGVSTVNFPMHPSSWCGSCSVKAACAYGRTLDA